jgi:hypothetical protein
VHQAMQGGSGMKSVHFLPLYNHVNVCKKIYKYLPPNKSNSSALYFTSIESNRDFTCREIKMTMYFTIANFSKKISGLFTY